MSVTVKPFLLMDQLIVLFNCPEPTHQVPVVLRFLQGAGVREEQHLRVGVGWRGRAGPNSCGCAGSWPRPPTRPPDSGKAPQ